MSAEGLFPTGLEALLSTLAVRLLDEGADREVELLAAAEAQLVQTRTDLRKGELYCLCLVVPGRLLQRLSGRQAAVEERLLGQARQLIPAPLRDKLAAVSLSPRLLIERNWREEARRRLRSARAQREPDSETLAPRVHTQVTVEVGGAAQPASEVARLAPAPRPKEQPLPIGKRYKWTRIA